MQVTFPHRISFEVLLLSQSAWEFFILPLHAFFFPFPDAFPPPFAAPLSSS
jgi:hypothetical protein